MRISDWSSDVCSSDPVNRNPASFIIVIVVNDDDPAGCEPPGRFIKAITHRIIPVAVDMGEGDPFDVQRRQGFLEQALHQIDARSIHRRAKARELGGNMLVKIVSIPIIRIAIQPLRLSGGYRLLARSEEHTSELQSLMRHSSAVFC